MPGDAAAVASPAAARVGPEGDLRGRAARGSIVNAGFLVFLNLLGLAKAFIVAAFLTQHDYGIWGILVVTLATIFWLKEVGVGDKYIQQDEADQERAFQKAFTLELVFNTVFLVVMLAAIPLFALLYGRTDIVAPGLALAVAVPAAALQTPLWVFYRKMDFVRQRALQAFDPVASFVVTVALAIAGLGYWSLVIGSIVGSWAAAIAAVRASPYPLRLRYDRSTLRDYFGFSWPLFVSGGSGVLIAQVPIFVAEQRYGVAAVGAIALASTISMYVGRADEVVTNTLYPAICAVKDRSELLFESFTKSNRMALLWGLPFGVGTALFAPDVVRFGIGSDRWGSAVVLIQAFGLIAAANQIGFNWTAFFRARGQTRPIAVHAGVLLVAVMAIAVPLLVTHGLGGFALGMGIATALLILVRTYFLSRLFPGLRMLLHIARAAAPTAIATAVLLAARAAEGAGSRSLATALAELAAYLLLGVVLTLVFERALVREVAGYLRRRRVAPTAAA